MCICDECRKIEFFSNIPTEDLKAEINRRENEEEYIERIEADEIVVLWTCTECGFQNEVPFENFEYETDCYETKDVCQHCGEKYFITLPE